MAFTQLPTGGGVPNVDLITQTLAKLQPDAALQNYARMHKNDPYILSLATAEANRRKALRLAAQGQNAGQQPTVVDQNIAGMAPAPVMTGSGGTLQTGYGGPVTTGMAAGGLPEDQGIAQLPAQNIQHMADGGIAGYGDGDDVPRQNGMAQGGMYDFAQRSEPVVRMADGGHVPRYQGNIRDGSVVSSNPMYAIPGMAAVQPRAEFTQQGAPENTPFFQRMFESLSSGNKERQLAMIAQKIAQGTATAEETAIYQAEMTKKPGQKQMGAPKDVVNPDETLMAMEKAGRNKAASDKAAADKAPPGAAPAPQAKLPTGIATLKAPTAAEATTASDKFFDADALTRRLDQQRLQERQDIATEATTREEKQAAFNEKQGPAMAGYAKLLDSEEKQDVTDKEKAGLMALFKGFLGIAAGESPNAAANIAKGAMLGLEDYSSALKDLKKSAKERNKERAFIENAQRAESRDDFKSQQLNEDKANDASRAADRAFTSAITQITGKKGELASGIYKDMVNNYEATNRVRIQEAAQNARTNATLAAPDAQSKFYGGLGGGDVKKGLAYYAETMGPDAKGLQAILKDYSGMVGEARLKSMETSKDPAERARAATIRQLQNAQMVGGIKPVNVAQDRNLLP